MPRRSTHHRPDKPVSEIPVATNFLSDLSAALRAQGQQRERVQKQVIRTLRNDMAENVAALRNKTDQELLDLFLDFSQYRSDPREFELRQEFNGHVQTEILRRMKPRVGLQPIGRRR